MSGDGTGFWTRGKLLAAAIVALLGAGGGILTLGRGAIAIIDAPANLTKHEIEAQERLDRLDQMMEDIGREFCTQLGLLPNQCPAYRREHR